MAVRVLDDKTNSDSNGRSAPSGGRIKGRVLSIAPPNLQRLAFTIIGESPYVQHRFGAKAKNMMREKMVAGSTSRKGSKRAPRDFDADYRDAMHVSQEGWNGIPAPAFRCALISACRTVGFAMTLAKLSIFVEADGYDAADGTPLVRITKGKPAPIENVVRNETGVADIRNRPSWAPGWEAVVRVIYDADQFTMDDVSNLLHRVGMQIGIGEGRWDSKRSAGMGWGTFRISSEPAKKGGKR